MIHPQHELVTKPRISHPVSKAVAPMLVYPHGRHSETEYYDWLRGKRVIIVGPAGYLQGRGKGEWIDSFDVVVRVNHAVPVSFPEDYGKRTDVLYHILSRRNQTGNPFAKVLVEREEIELWKKEGVEWLVCRHASASNRAKEMGPKINGLLKWCCIHHSFTTRITQSFNSKTPNTGVAAIIHLLASDIASLDIVGFDLYASGVYSGYGDLRPGEDAKKINDKWHDTREQIEYLRRVYKREARLHIDDHLKGILKV